MSTLEWYEDLLKKTSDSDFKENSFSESDIFKLKIHDGETVFAEWDLSDELKQNGVAFKNYTNASQNIDAEFFFMHQDLVEKFQDDESFQNIQDKILNTSLEHKFLNSETSATLGGGLRLFTSLIIGLGSASLILGSVGLIIKARSAAPARVVKVTRISGSVICILAGIFSIVAESMTSKGMTSSTTSRHFSATSTMITASAANAVLKAILLSWKFFTVIIYIFQNIMLYRPFFFREHKKALGRWFLRISLAQMVLIMVGFLIWAIILILVTSDLCNGIVDHSEAWNVTLIAFCGVGYGGSLVLSLVFVIGYYRQSVSELRQSETKNIKKTLISCSMEILFDLMVVVAHWANFVPCLSFKPYQLEMKFNFAGLEEKNSRCDQKFRWWTLNSGLSPCTTYIFLSQPVIQEVFFLSFEFVAAVKRKCFHS